MCEKEKSRDQLLAELKTLRKKVTLFEKNQSEFEATKENLQLYQAHLEEMTDMRTTELLEALNKAEKANKTKDSFLANMSHEFHTPIHQINNYSQFGLQKLTKAIETEVAVPEAKLLQYFENIYHASENLFAFISSLLDLTKLETGEIQYGFKRRNIMEAVRAAQYGISEECQERDLAFEILESDVSTEVEIDEQWLGVVLKNLFSNAIRFSPPGGSITVSFTQNQLSLFEKSQECLQINITDQGVGIPDEELDLIFEKFTQSSRTEDGSGGKGIGLAICRKIITDHGGEIHAVNNPEYGATFSIIIPYHQPEFDSETKIFSGFDSL